MIRDNAVSVRSGFALQFVFLLRVYRIDSPPSSTFTRFAPGKTGEEADGGGCWQTALSSCCRAEAGDFQGQGGLEPRLPQPVVHALELRSVLEMCEQC